MLVEQILEDARGSTSLVHRMYSKLVLLDHFGRNVTTLPEEWTALERKGTTLCFGVEMEDGELHFGTNVGEVTCHWTVTAHKDDVILCSDLGMCRKTTADELNDIEAFLRDIVHPLVQ